MLTPSLGAKKNVRLKKIRELPIAGEILVKVAEEVSAETIVARAILPGDLSIMRVAELMGISRDEALSALRVKVGDEVMPETILSEHTGICGLFRSQLNAGMKGVVEFISSETAHVGLRGEPTVIAINAYVRGRVSKIDGKQAVTIETCGSLVQGIFGVGGERVGKLFLLAISPSDDISPEDIPADTGGKILVGGRKPSLAALQFAAAQGAVGFVCGSIDDVTLSSYVGHEIGVAITGDEDVPMTLIITEGFGELALSEKVLAILKPLHDFEASINGATQVRAGAVRPEIIVPSGTGSAEEVAGAAEFELGQKVRIIRVPYFGLEAEITELPHELVTIETGAHTRVLKVRLPSQEIVTVPRANVEII